MRQAPRLGLGIVGGLGPLASADFYAKLTALTAAVRDSEHLPLVLLSVPQIPDRSAAILDGAASPLADLEQAVRLLDGLGVECIVITCNTAYHWYEALARASRARLLHIADGVVRALSQSLWPRGRVAVLATRGTLASGYYQRRLEAAGFDLTPPRMPELQLRVDRIIAAVKAGSVGEAACLLEGVLASLQGEGFRGVVFACTELPVAYAASRPAHGALAAIDATLELAREALIVLGYPIRKGDGADGPPCEADRHIAKVA